MALIKKEKFLSSVTQVLKGTVSGQIVSIAAIPLLTRLFSVEAFAALGVLNTVVGAFGPAAAGRLDVAAAVHKDAADRNKLSASGFWLAAVCCIALGLIFNEIYRLGVLSDKFQQYIEIGVIGPLAIFVFTCVQIGRYSANGRGDFSLLGISALLMAVSFFAISLLFWTLNWVEFGLIAAFLVSQSLVALFLFQRSNLFPSLLITRRHLTLVYQNRSFPLYNATSTLLDGITVAMPLFFLMSHYSVEDVALYSVVLRFISAPLSMIGYAVSQVVLKHVADDVNFGKPTLMKHLKLSLGLAVGGLFIILAGLIFNFLDSKLIFEYVFGPGWGGLGLVFIMLSPSIAVRFVVSSVSPIFSATGHNQLSAVWKVLCFICTAMFFTTMSGELIFEDLLAQFVILDVILYLIYFLASVYASSVPIIKEKL